jgi:ABC-2 type transport system ATP-binding protein
VTTAIEMQQVDVVRGDRHVVRGVTTSVPAGSVVGLLGPSGCGKTTLLRSIVGVQANVEGDVTVLGLRAGDPRLRSQVGYASQKHSLYDDLSVRENIHYFSRLLGVDPGRGQTVLDNVQLADMAGQRVDRLSGGQMARCSLAVAVLNEPRLLILDEPTVGLDPVLRAELWQLFLSLAADGVTLLVSSHVMEEAARCQWLLLMRDGRILAEGSPQQLLEVTSSNSVEEAFLKLIESKDKQ